jgi:hypothetical protein
MYVVFGFSRGESLRVGVSVFATGAVFGGAAAVPGGVAGSARAVLEKSQALVATRKKRKNFIDLASCASMPGKNLCQASANAAPGKACPSEAIRRAMRMCRRPR